MDYFDFRRGFEKKLDQLKLKLPADCTIQEPLWEVIVPPHSWQIEIFFRFADHNHIRLWEYYAKVAGLQFSRRLQWSYHYGPITKQDAHGNIMVGEPDDPLALRIDTCDGLHLHFNDREPHYQQERVKGLALEQVDWVRFATSVLRHRKSAKPLDQVFGFTLEANA